MWSSLFLNVRVYKRDTEPFNAFYHEMRQKTERTVAKGGRRGARDHSVGDSR
jgi:hypothetical protein